MKQTTEQVGIQGSPGANHEIAARQMYGQDVKIDYIPTFEELFGALRQQKVGRAVVAFSNTSIEEAFIRAPHRELIQSGTYYWITDKTDVFVRHQLLTLPGVSLDQIKTVHSMGIALEQCETTLRRILPEAQLVHEEDTALSAELVREMADPTQAAVATLLAGELNGLVALVANIQDDSKNITSFIGLSLRENGLARVTGYENTTLMLVKPSVDGAGILYHALRPFDELGINLADLHIESSPGSGERTKQFLIEAQAGSRSVEMKEALKRLGETGFATVLLGSWSE